MKEGDGWVSICESPFLLAWKLLGQVAAAENSTPSWAFFTGAWLGPVIAGTLAEYATWRWFFWLTTIMQCVSYLLPRPVKQRY